MATFLYWVQNAPTLERVAGVVFGGNGGAILVAQEMTWMDGVMFLTFMIWWVSAPVLIDDELSVNLPMKKSRDL